MNLSHDITRRIERYLNAVKQHLSHRPAAVRREILAGLREQINEALGRQGQDTPDLNTLERILGEMDAPEDFGENAESLASPRPASSSSASRWFWLFAAFLLVNGYGVWKWTSSLPPRSIPADPSVSLVETTDTAGVTNPAPLEVISVQQLNITADRRVTLRLIFNDAPNRDLLPRYFRLSSKSQPQIPYRLQGTAGTNSVWIQTEPVLHNQLVCHLSTGLPTQSGDSASVKAYEAALTLSSEFVLSRLRTESPAFDAPVVNAEFNAFPDPNGLSDFIEVEPAVSYTVEPYEDWRGAGVRLVGDFQPGSVYAITFKAGLPAVNGSSLNEPITRLVQFQNRSSSIAFDTGGRYLSPKGDLAIPVKIVNRDQWRVSLRPVYANNLVQLALRESNGYPYYGSLIQELTGTEVTQTNRLTAPPNEVVQARVRLRELIAEPRGAYWMEAEGDSRLIVVTDLGIVTRRYKGGALVWVNSLESGRPVEGAEVTLFARNNQTLVTATTDAEGLVRFEHWGDDDPFLVTARKDTDLSYIDLSRTRVEQGSGLEGAAYLSAAGMEAAVFTERGVYRPGEQVFMQALVRNADQRAPKPFPTLFRVRRPDGRVVKDIPVMLDQWGAAQAMVELSNYLPTGRYALELVMPGTFTVLGETSVALEDFVPPQIRVTVDSAPDRARAGSSSVFWVRSAHLFGRAAAGLSVQGYVTIKAVPFAPTAWEGWRFGDEEKVFAPIYRPLGATTLDEEGHTEFTVETASAWRPPAALQLVQQATVLESGGRPVNAYGSVMLDAYPFYIGLRPAWEGTIRVGETQRVSVAEVLPNGEPLAEGKPLSISLSRITWHSVLREVGGGRYEWKSERQAVAVREDTIKADGDPSEWVFSVDTMGAYMLVVRDLASGSSVSMTFDAASHEQDWISWSREKPGRVELSWDRETYRPGDTARLLVKAPFSGQALLTLESDHVITTRVVVLEQNTAEFEIPVESAYAPNVYCVLTLVRPAVAESVWSPHRAMGAIALPVERPGRRLTVTAETPAVQRPQSTLTARLTVRDEEGQPVQGAITVMAVDEGICLLTAFETPEPNRIFTAQRRLGVLAYDLYHELMPIVEDELAVAARAGGDAGDALRRRLNPINAKRFKPVALWRADVVLDKEGQATVELKVPEFTGTLRVMAVAYNEWQSGSTDAKVPVKRDLIVQPALPRFMALGDISDVGVTLFNEGASEMTVRLSITCGGPLRSDKAEETVVLGAGRSTRVPFNLLAGPGPGKAICRIEVQGGADRYDESIELPIRPTSGLQVDSVNAILAAGDQVTLTAPGDWLPATIEQSGVISSMPVLQLGRALDYVWNYPYGCVEQTASGGFPLLYLAEWAERMLPSAIAEGDVGARVRNAIYRVLSMQQGDGGFGLWPFENKSDPAASLYVAHFLVEAQAAGFDVPEDRLDTVLGWLRNRLDHAAPIEAGTAEWMDDMDQRAYACHILAIAGRPDRGWTARLYEQVARLYFASRVHVASALLLTGEPRQAVSIMESLGMPTTRDRLPGRLLNSDVRDASLLLSAWLDVESENQAVPQLVHYLQSGRTNDHWGNTQDNAMALLALGKYAQRTADKETAFSGKMMTGDTITTLSSTQDVYWAEGPGQGKEVTIKNDGPGRMYVRGQYTGVSTQAEEDKEQQVRVQRDFLDQEGKAMDPSILAQGDLVVVRITVNTLGGTLDQLIIEELLPAGWEIENPNLVTSRSYGWLANQKENARYRDARDDRMLFFTGMIKGEASFHYAARAVTPGAYTYPPVTVSGMYEPAVRAVQGGRVVHVTP